MCEKLANGIPLREICRQDNMPHWSNVYEWMAKDQNLSVAIARARELGQDAIAEDTLMLVDAPPERGPDGKIDQGYVQWRKLQVEQRLKLLAKWNPKRYGDRIHTEHSGKISTDMDDDELDRLIRERQQALEKAGRD